VADAHKSFGQDVQGKAPDEFLMTKGNELFLPTLAVVFSCKNDGIVCNGFNAVVAQGDCICYI